MNNEKLNFSLGWSKAGAGRLTTIQLAVLIGEKTIWPVEGADHISLEVQADDLLSHLTEFWKPLLLRQTYPIAIQPERPSLLRAEVEKNWGSTPAELLDREEAQLIAFEEAHDLSRSFSGQFDLPPLWMIREADNMLIETRSGVHSVLFDAARVALTMAGDEISSHLADSGTERWADLVNAWQSRDSGDPAVLLAWSTSLDQAVARTFVGEGILVAPESVAEAARDNDELCIAARMASALPPDQIRQIIQLVTSFPKRTAPELDQLATRVSKNNKDHFSSHRAYEQGEAAASFIREHLELASVQFFQIFELVQSLGVSLITKAVEPQTLTALAVSGNRHGPAILLNANKLRKSQGSIERNSLARVTLAHELCHLLLDRGHALGAVEVLHNRMPPAIESRAKAFAGELLLPGRVAADIWIKAKSPRSTKELDTFLVTLGRRFGVTKSVAAWKLEHGLHKHDVDLRILLNAVVPNR